MRDQYLYPHTNVLKNLLNITNASLFEEAEADYTSLRIKQLIQSPVKGKFSVTHFCNIHKFIFQDIFSWAGQFRKMNIEKDEPALGDLSVEYCDFKQIGKNLKQTLLTLNQTKWVENQLEQNVNDFSKILASIWKIHPFREGNTRTTIIFMCQFAHEHNIKLNRELFAKHIIYVRTALAAYNATFSDIGDYSKKEYLENFVKDAMTKS